MSHTGETLSRGPALKRLASTLLVAVLVLLAGCEKPPEAQRFRGPIFGTGYHVTLYTDARDFDRDAIDAGIRAELEHVDALMSTYRDDSELSRINRAPPGIPLFVSPAIAEVLGESLRIARLSEGAFDVTVGSAVNLWGFGPRARPDKVPDDEVLAAALARIDFRALHLDNGRLTKTAPVYIDLSGIAKGYATDQVADYLKAQGIEDYLVEVGGEVRAHGKKPDGSPWRVAVEKPLSSERSVQRVVELGNAAVATSGDYRNYFESDGIRYSHTIDPRTGRPIDNRVASVTVIAERCSTADALATTFTVMGADSGLEMAERENIAVYLVVRSDDGFETLISSAFESYLANSTEEENP